MRILFLGNNWLAAQTLKWLREQNEEIVGLVLHPPHRRKFGNDLLKTAGLPSAQVFDGSLLEQIQVLESIRALQPEVGLSVMFGYIVRQRFLDELPLGCLNVHPSFLPYNRGAYPNVWSIVDGTPAGVTIHYIDSGVDTGDIVAQERIVVEQIDTGETLYRKLEQCALDLIKRTWPQIRLGMISRTVQDKYQGTLHRVKDTERIDEIDLDRTYTARELINVIRARTFGDYPGVFFRVGGRKVYLRLQLSYDQKPDGSER
jgi:methionyl-tRNA formyltransferase